MLICSLLLQKPKTTSAWGRSASPQPGGSSGPHFPQRAEPGQVADCQFLLFSRHESPPQTCSGTWRVLEQQLSCLAGAGAPGVLVFALGFLVVQDKCIGTNSNCVSSPAALMLRRALPATIGLNLYLFCPLSWACFPFPCPSVT